MKKGFLVILIFSLFVPVFSQEIPESLCGIWEGKDRIVFFEENQSDKNPELFVVLKDFYGWYYDRAAEAKEYSEKSNKARNDATPKTSEQIPFTVDEYQFYNAYCLNINYSRHESYSVPFCLINDNIFLNFYTRDLNPDDEEQVELAKTTYDGFYRGNIVSKGIMISDQLVPENIACFYVIGNKVYNIRYWKSDMDYQSDYVNFTYGEDSFSVPRHIQTGGYLYSCVSGRSKKVRNPQPAETFLPENYIFDENHRVMVIDKNIYLTKLADKKTFEELVEIVNNANSRKHDPIRPLFPEQKLDFHWDLIDALEKNNSLIQAVRERQKAFGLRGKDIGN